MQHNAATGGGSGVQFQLTPEQITTRCQPPIERDAPALWEAAAGVVEAHYRGQARQD
ncbi:MAG: hypothetical protein PHT48_09025 [Dechloromonas sp.]|nr:hypothetical protein [Dechloromonas sp.]